MRRPTIQQKGTRTDTMKAIPPVYEAGDRIGMFRGWTTQALLCQRQ
jgi:hypothetical protein